MSVGFGFSVGDFIAATKLVGTVIDALGASSKSSSELQELLRQLDSLETALQEVKHLEINDSLHAEVLALKQSAAQCQLTITDFLRKTESYQPHLLCTNGASSTLQGKWRKIKWALCKKKDVVQFKTDLLAHTESIQLLLATIQMKSIELCQNSQQSLQRSVASQIQDGFSSCMRKLSTVSGTLSMISAQAQECLQDTRRIISMNIRVFQAVLDVQNLLKTIPGQIERQQPVFLNDALGRYAPFHLEFIKSSEALVSVLSINFKSFASASKKIQNCEFTIHDSHTKRDVDLNRPWDECFMPGQQVEMSMIFDRIEVSSTSCVKCRHKCAINAGEDITCEKCGFVFRTIPVVENLDNSLDGAATEPQQPTTDASNRSLTQLSSKPALPKRKLEDDEDLTNYRRVRLRIMQPQPLNQIQHGRRFRMKVYRLQKNDWFDLGTGFGKKGVLGIYTCITVTSENDSNHTICKVVCNMDLGFQKQKDSLIVWTEEDGYDMALSFQNPKDCAEIWNAIVPVDHFTDDSASPDSMEENTG